MQFPPNETTNRARFRYTQFDELPALVVANTILKARKLMETPDHPSQMLSHFCHSTAKCSHIVVTARTKGKH
eukprot:6190751-Pleurochrysis_carterae.AAC.3